MIQAASKDLQHGEEEFGQPGLKLSLDISSRIDSVLSTDRNYLGLTLQTVEWSQTLGRTDAQPSLRRIQ